MDSPLKAAIEQKKPDRLKLLLRHPKLEVNFEDDFDGTPLTFAVKNGYTNAVKALLEHEDTDVNLPEGYDNFPLMLAVQTGNVKIVRDVLGHPKIQVNDEDDFGRTALDFAQKRKFRDIEKLLLVKGARFNSADRNGRKD